MGALITVILIGMLLGMSIHILNAFRFIWTLNKFHFLKLILLLSIVLILPVDSFIKVCVYVLIAACVTEYHKRSLLKN